MKSEYEQQQQIDAEIFETREKDWRNGAIIYQVFVDRFAPSNNLSAKAHLYPEPKKLHPWNEEPVHGKFLPEERVWSHEIDFWGGDLQSLASKLGHITDLGANVLYLNPIHLATTNHKYDATDYMQVSAEYGTMDDLQALINQAHQHSLKVMLDGVFNHVGVQNPIYQTALADPRSPYRDWFTFNPKFSHGVGLWSNAPSLPELRFENQEVRDYIYEARNSVVRSYLRMGIDGWRLDTAFELGFNYLEELTRAAHEENSGSAVIGEIHNYPQGWFPALDGVMNFTARHIIYGALKNEITPAVALAMLTKMIEDAGMEPMLRSWMVLDNHDTARLPHTLPQPWQQQMAQVLQFTLPGSPNLYYGVEVGMDGGEDPKNRAPMRWDLVKESNPHLAWIRKLIGIRKDNRALAIGDYRPLVCGKLIAFERYTDRIDDTVIVIVNPGDSTVEETTLLADSRLMNHGKFTDLLGGNTEIRIFSGLIRVKIPAHGFAILNPVTGLDDSYTSYKRIR